MDYSAKALVLIEKQNKQLEDLFRPRLFLTNSSLQVPAINGLKVPRLFLEKMKGILEKWIRSLDTKEYTDKNYLYGNVYYLQNNEHMWKRF